MKLVIAILFCTACLYGQSLRSDVKSGEKQIGSLVLMPVQVSLTKLGMKGPESMMEESRNAEISLAMEIAAALSDLGYELDLSKFSQRALGKDDDLRYLIDDLQKRFDRELPQLKRKSKDVRKGRFSIGDEVAKLPLNDATNALFFVRGSGRVLTESKKVFGTLIAGPGGDKSSIDLGIVDAKNGDVVYFAKLKIDGDFTYDVEQVARQLAKAFAELPRLPGKALNARSQASSDTVHPDPAPTSAPAVETGPSPSSSSSGSTASSPRRLRVSHAVLKNLLIESRRPAYPGIASMNYVQGDVVLRVVINKDGRVADVKVASGAAQLVPAATSAVKFWRYRPLTLNGEVFEAETEITFSFKMGQ